MNPTVFLINTLMILNMLCAFSEAVKQLHPSMCKMIRKKRGITMKLRNIHTNSKAATLHKNVYAMDLRNLFDEKFEPMENRADTEIRPMEFQYTTAVDLQNQLDQTVEVLEASTALAPVARNSYKYDDQTYFWSGTYTYEQAEQFCYARDGRLIVNGARNATTWEKLFDNGPRYYMWIGAAEAVINSGNFVWSSLDACCDRMQWRPRWPTDHTIHRECVSSWYNTIMVFHNPCTAPFVSMCEKVN